MKHLYLALILLLFIGNEDANAAANNDHEIVVGKKREEAFDKYIQLHNLNLDKRNWLKWYQKEFKDS